MISNMKYINSLTEGKLIKRYKRFFADIEYKGKVITAHLPNTGSLKTVPLENTNCLFSKSDDPKRKLAYTLEMIQTNDGWAGVNTRTPNTIVKEALESHLVKGFNHVQSEVKISESTRIDFVLFNFNNQNEKPPKLKYPHFFNDFKSKDLYFIEVKNVTMKEGTTAMFPDGITARGTKHLQELIELKEKGFSTELIFTIQRQNCSNFKIADHFDPTYDKKIKEAIKAGVKISAYEVKLSSTQVFLNTTKKIPVEI